MLKTLLEEFEPHAWVNVHSGMEALFLPYDHKASRGRRGRDARHPSGDQRCALRRPMRRRRWEGRRIPRARNNRTTSTSRSACP